jgi:hypothetical protein
MRRERVTAAEADDRERIFGKIFGSGSRSFLGADGKIVSSWRNYQIWWDLRDDIVHVQSLVKQIARAEARIREQVGIFPDRIAIEICKSESELPSEGTGLSHFPGWIGGAFDGTIRVLSDPLGDGSPDSLYVFLAHELVHAALAAFPGRALPCWFEEGLAVWMSQNLPGHYRDALDEARRSRRLLPLGSLEQPFVLLDPARIPLAYAQSASVVEFLDERAGRDLLRALIPRAKRRGFGAALKSESLTVELLEQDWKRWLGRRPIP